jgi:hypothetical protein
VLQLPPLTRGVRLFLYGLVGAFVAQLVAENLLAFPAFALLGLSGQASIAWAWQWASYPFVDLVLPQGGLLLVKAVTLFFLYLMIAPFEARYGARRLWQLLSVATVAGALPAMAGGLLLGGLAGSVYGTQNLFLAALAAFAATVRGGRVMLFGAFAMEAWQLLLSVVIFATLFALMENSVLFWLSQMGAIGGGYGYAHWLTRPRRSGDSKGKKRRRGGPKLRVIDGGETEDERPRYLN